MATRSIVLLCLLLPSFIVCSSPRVARFCEDPWPPFVKGEINQEATGGFTVKILNEVLKRVGNISLEVQILPWKRCLMSIKDGTMDGYVDGIYSTDREDYIVVTDPYYYGFGTWVYSVERFPNGFEWNQFSDFKNYQVLGVLGWHYQNVDDAIDKGLLKLHRVRTIEQAFDLVLKGRADFTISEDLSIRDFLKNNNTRERLRTTKKPAYVTLRRVGIGKKSPLLNMLPAINQAIGELKVEGFIDQAIDDEL